MDWKMLKKDWKDFQGKFKTRWPKLDDSDLKAIAGDRDELVKRLVKRYTIEKQKVEKEVDDFVKTIKPLKV